MTGKLTVPYAMAADPQNCACYSKDDYEDEGNCNPLVYGPDRTPELFTITKNGVTGAYGYHKCGANDPFTQSLETTGGYYVANRKCTVDLYGMDQDNCDTPSGSQCGTKIAVDGDCLEN